MKFEPPPSPIRRARRSPAPEPVLVEERADAVEDQQRRLRQALGVGRGLDDVADDTVRSYAADVAAACTSCATPRSRTSASDGRPVNPAEVPLNEDGVAQAQAVAEALRSDRPRPRRHERAPATLETAASSRPESSAESWPELREIQGGRLSEIPADALEHEFVHAFRGVIPNDARFLRGESIGELFDRVLPALDRLVADRRWNTALAVLHGGVNRAILSYALTGERMFLGHFEQAPACVNVLDLGDGGEWIVRAVNVAPLRPPPPLAPPDDDGALLGAVARDRNE